VDNLPPALRVTSPRPGETTGAGDRTLKLAVDVTDNVEVAYVEFYHGDQLLATVKEAPFEIDWKIDQDGPQTFYMIVYDSAGNSTRSDIVRVNVARSP
jgi:hypothetical protein